MKRFLLIMCALLSAFAAPAQGGQQKVELKDGQVLVGLYTSDNYEKFAVALGGNMLLQAGTRIPDKYYAGMADLRVVAMRFAIAESTHINKVRLYAFTADNTIVGPIAVSECNRDCLKGWNTVEFSAPVEVKPEYVALMPTYEFQQTMTNLVIATSFEPKEPSLTVYGPLRTDSDESFWANMNAAKYGSAAIQLICTASNLSGTRVSPDGYVSNTVVVGETYRPTLSINTSSEDPIESIDYTITLGDQKVQKTHTFSPALPAGFNLRHDFEAEVTAPAQAGAYQLAFSIDKVNGTPVTTLATAQYKQLVVTRKAHRMSLVEEFTGTACGYCPRGWVGMEKVKKELSQEACVIALHKYDDTDPMYGDYYHMPSFIGGAPAAVVDRYVRSCDPYFGEKVDGKEEGIINTVKRHSQLLPEVDIQQLKANYTDENRMHVRVTATTEFLTDLDGSQIIFVLTADSLTGTNSAWQQLNFYGGMTPEQAGASPDVNPDLYKLLKGQEYGDTKLSLVYNDVMIGSSWPGPAVPNEVLPFTTTRVGTKASSVYTLSLPTTPILLKAIKREEVYVTAFVLKADGSVANAARCRVDLTPVEANNRRMYVEDATGTWCGWCPKGLVGLKRMRETHPDRFIGVGVHCGEDPMNTFQPYSDWIVGLGLTAYPTCYVNRDGQPRNPNYTVLEDYYTNEFRKYSELNVSVSATLEGKELKMTSFVTPIMDLYATSYNVAFVVLEDGPTAVQENFYFDGNSGEMGGFEKLPMKAPTTYEDVARGIWPTVTGLGSGAIQLPADMKAGETVRNTCSVPLSYFKCEDVNHCHVVALVINSAGEVENAAEFYIDPTGVQAPLRAGYEKLSAPAFDLQGRRVNPSSLHGITLSAGRKLISK